MIARAVPAALRSFEQPLDFGFVQKILVALVRVGRLGRRPAGREIPFPTLFLTLLFTLRPLAGLFRGFRKPASHIGSVYHTLYEKRLLYKVRARLVGPVFPGCGRSISVAIDPTDNFPLAGS